MKFTIEVERDSEHPNQWVSTCKELDVISAAMSPGEALEAVAEAVRMVLTYEVAHRNSPNQEYAYATIALEVLERSR
jgi:predicted RNase H-like HicB family nuclease